jgi:hypothetical protein
MIPDNIKKSIKNMVIDVCIYENAIESMKKRNIDESDNGYKLIQREKVKVLNKLKFYCNVISIDYKELLLNIYKDIKVKQ